VAGVCLLLSYELPVVFTTGGADITLLQQFFINPACVLPLLFRSFTWDSINLLLINLLPTLLKLICLALLFLGVWPVLAFGLRHRPI
jgi:hypothetical protein